MARWCRRSTPCPISSTSMSCSAVANKCVSFYVGGGGKREKQFGRTHPPSSDDAPLQCLAGVHYPAERLAAQRSLLHTQPPSSFRRERLRVVFYVSLRACQATIIVYKHKGTAHIIPKNNALYICLALFPSPEAPVPNEPRLPPVPVVSCCPASCMRFGWLRSRMHQASLLH
jgi:hypothetical protein